MKSKSNEWVSISDLMSGVMAVVMLLLVVSVLQKTYAELKHEQALQNSAGGQQAKVAQILTDLQSTIKKEGAQDLVVFNLAESRVTLQDNMFDKSSACITSVAESAVYAIKDKIIEHLQNSPSNTVFIEGHTDNTPIAVPVINFQKYCAVYDDNFTLSSARAREARKLLTKGLDLTQANRIIVAGYGDSRPLPKVDPSSSLNRRIEIQFIIGQ